MSPSLQSCRKSLRKRGAIVADFVYSVGAELLENNNKSKSISYPNPTFYLPLPEAEPENPPLIELAEPTENPAENAETERNSKVPYSYISVFEKRRTESEYGIKEQDLIPRTLRCTCGSEEELSNLFDCYSCSDYLICSLCSMKQHWGHEVKTSIENVLLSATCARSENTHKKLARWAEGVKRLHEQGSQEYGKLCDLLSSAFKKASSSEEIEQVEEILLDCDVSSLDGGIAKLIAANIQTITAVREVAQKVQSHVQ